mgnify:CR=1 FL=1
MKKVLRDFLGIDFHPASHRERLLSGLGGMFGVIGILLVSRHFVGMSGAGLIVASMGASSVLLFAVPHGPLSQPWAVFGGHLISALIGITCAAYITDTVLAAGLAVGLAISAMYYLRCIHPPGGATALVAVIGGSSVHNLGYRFMLEPVLLNVLVILAVAILFNYPFLWRRYPAHLGRLSHRTRDLIPASPPSIDHADFVYALSQLDSYVDVSEEDLLLIYTLATGRSKRRHLTADKIILWHAYSNGGSGWECEIRDIIDESHNLDPARDKIIYRVLSGQKRRDTGVMTRIEFAHWARYEACSYQHLTLPTTP